MLSQEALPLIQATLPVVKEYGEQITRHFYQRMFRHHPELKNLFNMGNQSSGEQAQALAGSIYGYAANLDQPEVLNPIMNRIAHKHVSLGIAPNQYTIVGRHLMAAIAEVLGEAATPAILEAWDEAYWLMATDLVAREARIYQDVTWDAGQDWLTAEVVNKEAVAADVISLSLRPQDGRRIPFMPGQYLSVALEVPALGLTQRRQYSLTGLPEEDELRISVKRELPGQGPAGRVSALLHDAVKPGDTLHIGPPAGDFVLGVGSAPLVLISAGIGITPVLSMLRQQAAASSPRQLVFAHANRAARHIAHLDEVTTALQRLPNARFALWLEEPDQSVDARSGRMALEAIPALPLDGDFYLCGPLPFMHEQRQWLLAHGVPADAIHYEAFGPDVFGHG